MVRVLLSFPLLFAIVASAFVGAFVATVPAGFGLDEMHHTFRAWQVSRGQLEPDTLSERLQYGGQIPEALSAYELAGTDASNAGRRTNDQPWARHDLALAPDFTDLGAARVQGSPLKTEDFTNAGASSFVAYAPAAVGMRVGTVLGLDVAGVVLLGKAFAGAVYVAFVTMAVLVLRRSRWRWLVAIVALLPQSVFQASIITADTMSNGVAILFAAAVLALHGRRQRSWPMLAGTLAVSLALVAVKPTYIVLVPALLTVPAAALGLGRRWQALVAQVGAVAVVGAVGLYLSSRVSAISEAIRTQVPDWPSVDQHAQLAGIVDHPLSIVGVVARTFIQYGESWVTGSIGLLGTNSVLVPQPFVIVLVAMMTLAAFLGDRWSWDRWRPLRGAVLLALALATVVAVIAALYLTFSTVGAANANGVQGRYWIPVFVPLLAGLGLLLPIRVQMSDRTAAITFGSASVLALAAALGVWCWTVY